MQAVKRIWGQSVIKIDINSRLTERAINVDEKNAKNNFFKFLRLPYLQIYSRNADGN